MSVKPPKRFYINGEHYRIKTNLNLQISPDSGNPFILYGGNDRPLLYGELHITNKSNNLYKFYIGLKLDTDSANNIHVVHVHPYADFKIDRLLFDNLMLQTFDVTKCKIRFNGLELERNIDVIPD